MILRSLLLGLFVVSARCTLFPENLEITYDYRALVKSSVSADDVTSDFGINATLVAKGLSHNSVYFYLKDVTYTAFTGKEPEETKTLDIPKQAEEITKPFVVVYDQAWLAIGVKTGADDKAWSVNIKKAIASLLQMDLTIFNKNPEITVKENTVYGNCDTAYSIKEFDSSKVLYTIQKKMTPKKCGSYRWKSDITWFDSDPNYEHRPLITVDRQYQIKASKVDYVIDEVLSYNRIEYKAIGYKGEPIVTIVKQEVKNVAQSAVENPTSISVDWPLQKLMTTFIKVDAEGARKDDVTGGRSVANQAVALEKAKRVIETIVSNDRSMVLGLNGAVKFEDESVSEALQVLNFMDYDGMTAIFNSYQSSQDEIDAERLLVFLSFVPYVGSRASALFIRDNILNEKINPEAAERILATFPVYYKYPDHFIAAEMYTILNASLQQEVKVASILSVASILGRAITQYPTDERLHAMEDGLIEDFKSTSDPFMLGVYVAALNNLRTKRVFEFVEGLITGENKEFKISTRTRALIMWSVKLEHAKYPKLMEKIYWPIFLNRDEDIKIRTCAFKILLTVPTLDDLLKLKYFYYDDPHPTLKALIRTYISSVMNTKTAFYTRTRKLMEQSFGSEFAKIDKKAVEYIHDFMYDYMDPELGFGVKLKGSTMGNLLKDKYVALYFQVSPQFDNYAMNADALLFQVSIEDAETRAYLKNATINTPRGIYLSAIHDANIPRDIILLKNNRVVGVYQNTQIALRKLMGISVEMLIDELNGTQYSTGFMINADIVVPTDLGVPVHSLVQIPNVNKVHSQYNENNTSKVFLLKTTRLFISSKVYNPITDLWHGTKRIQATFANLPLSYSLELSRFPNMTLLHTENGVRKSYGFRSLSNSYVFVEDAQTMDNRMAKKKLQLSCEDCRTETSTTRENADSQPDKIFDYKFERLGMHATLSASGSKDCRSRSRFFNIARTLFNSSLYNDHGFYLPSFLMRLDYLLKYPVLYPMKGNCDVEFYINPMYDQNKITVSFTDDTTNVTNQMLTDGIEVKRWNLKADFIPIQESLNATFVEYKGEQETERYCANLQYDNFGYHFNLAFKLTTGRNDEGECASNQTVFELFGNVSIPDSLDPFKLKGDVYRKCVLEQYKWYECASDATLLRRYEIEIPSGEATKKILNFKHYFNGIVDLPEIYSIDENRLKMTFDVDPTDNRFVIKDKDQRSIALGWPLVPLSSHISPYEPLKHLFQVTGSCAISANRTFEDWTKVVGGFFFTVDVKNVGVAKESLLGLRISTGDRRVEIEMAANGTFLVNENNVTATIENFQRYVTDWYYVTVSKGVMLIYAPGNDMNIAYVGHYVRLTGYIGCNELYSDY